MPRGNGNGNGNGKAPERKVPVQTHSQASSAPVRTPSATRKPSAQQANTYRGQKAVVLSGGLLTSSNQTIRNKSLPRTPSDEALPRSRSTSPTARQLTKKELLARKKSKTGIIENDDGAAQKRPRSRQQLDALGAARDKELRELGKKNSKEALKKMGLGPQEVARARGQDPMYLKSTNTTKPAVDYNLAHGREAHLEQHVASQYRPSVGTGETKMCRELPTTPGAPEKVFDYPIGKSRTVPEEYTIPATNRCGCNNPACKQGVTTEGTIACKGCGQPQFTTNAVPMNAILSATASSPGSIEGRDTAKKADKLAKVASGVAGRASNQSGSNNPAGKATSSKTTHVKGGKPGSSRKT